MPNIVTLVEGPGDIDAVPGLLYKILRQHQKWNWQVTTKQVKGLGALRKNLEKFMVYSEGDADGGGILILLDLDDGCPKTEALTLARQIRALNLSCPSAVVFACREYEAWFLASIDAIVSQFNLFHKEITFTGDVESIRGVKGWLTRQMPPGYAYKETTHQKVFTNLMDIDKVCQRSRSFRRLCKAIEELVTLSENGTRGQVTPIDFSDVNEQR